MTNLLESFISGNERVIDKIPPIIFQSWKRCRALNINHERIAEHDLLQHAELKELLEINEVLLVSAKPVLQHIFAFLRGKNYLLVLSNNEGYILETVGDPSVVKKAAQKILLKLGANWQESSKGTNGVGTVLIEKTPLAIPGWTHYSSPVSFLDCWAAPIKRTDGELIGVLNISGEIGSKHEHLMEITIAGANMIEQSIRIAEEKEKYNLCRENLDSIGKILSTNTAYDVAGAKKSFVVFREDVNQNKQPKPLIGKKINEVFAQNCNFFSANAKDDDTHFIGPGQQWYGRSAKIRVVFDVAERASKVDSTVLIQGESGTGKEIVARYIHTTSLRKDKPFITINCASIPCNLVESELFGYIDGAFTGAKKGGHPGKFELANGGTIFLDEIGDMPFNIQASLLRVLQQKEINRIGEGRCRKIDVRVIAATNQDLMQLVTQGKFRSDLYYRLNVILITIPPLRERIEDLWDLVPHFVYKICTKLGVPVLNISSDLYQHLLNCAWPGNARQLENCIESMVALSFGSSTLTPDELPSEYKTPLQELNSGSTNILSLQSSNLEKMTIVQSLKDVNGNIAAAARKLGIGRTTLYRKLDKLLIPYKNH